MDYQTKQVRLLSDYSKQKAPVRLSQVALLTTRYLLVTTPQVGTLTMEVTTTTQVMNLPYQ
jgi:hypothetical protein